MAITQKASWVQRLVRSSSQLVGGIGDKLKNRRIDAEFLMELEEQLIAADMGVETAAKLVAEFGKQRMGEQLDPQSVRHFAAQFISDKLAPYSADIFAAPSYEKPRVILIVGANGSGKTTTIGKIAAQFTAQGKKVMIAACDSFRAAAVEQLAEWCRRSGSVLVRGEENGDPASLAFKAVTEAKTMAFDILLIDTAGRLHTRSELMAELSKIERVIKKAEPSAPHEILLVLDATIGQTAMTQIEVFTAAVKLSGLIITKLDGTAKAGIAIAICNKFKLPIFAVGMGESIEDLQPFSAMDYAKGLLAIE